MDMSKKSYNSPERRKRREENWSIFSQKKETENVFEKPRCIACSECTMGVIGCDDDRRPHGHGSDQQCQECEVPFYKVHPHSNVCSRGAPVNDDVRHDETHMKHQLRWRGWPKNKEAEEKKV